MLPVTASNQLTINPKSGKMPLPGSRPESITGCLGVPTFVQLIATMYGAEAFHIQQLISTCPLNTFNPQSKLVAHFKLTRRLKTGFSIPDGPFQSRAKRHEGMTALALLLISSTEHLEICTMHKEFDHSSLPSISRKC